MIGNFFKKTASSIAFLLIFVILLIISSYIFTPKNNLKEFGMNDVSANGILGEKENTIDILVLGDSEAYSSVSPMQIWKDFGYTSYVCATSAQYLSYSETLLKQAFQKQKPKLVILETYNIYRKMKFENSIMTKIENYFSVFKYHDRWKNIRENDLWDNVEYTWTDDFKGYHFSDNVDKANRPNYMKKTDEVGIIPSINKSYVKSISDFCHENGADFLLVSTPSCKNWNYKYHNGIELLAQELDIQLCNSEIAIDWSKDTKDKGDHLNHSGAVKMTRYLGKYIDKNYSLTDNRKNEEYSKWNEALERYLNKVK